MLLILTVYPCKRIVIVLTIYTTIGTYRANKKIEWTIMQIFFIYSSDNKKIRERSLFNVKEITLEK